MRCLIVLAAALIASQSFAQEVTFRCLLQNDSKGFKIEADNPTPRPRRCSATCELVLADGKFYRPARCTKSLLGRETGQFICGDGNVQGNPLRSAQITEHSCDP